MDRPSRVHPVVPSCFSSPRSRCCSGSGRRGIPAPAVAGLLAAGWLFWTLTEYWLHRLVFHFEPDNGMGARLHWIIHGVHHDHPNDPLRLVMLPSVSVPLAFLFYLRFAAVLGSPDAYLFTAGFLGGYLAYDMTHFHVHITSRARGSASPCGAAHAAPLPGRHARLRGERLVLGRVPHPPGAGSAQVARQTPELHRPHGAPSVEMPRGLAPQAGPPRRRTFQQQLTSQPGSHRLASAGARPSSRAAPGPWRSTTSTASNREQHAWPPM